MNKIEHIQLIEILYRIINEPTEQLMKEIEQTDKEQLKDLKKKVLDNWNDNNPNDKISFYMAKWHGQ